MFTLFILMCLAGYIITQEKFLLVFILIFTFAYDVIAITQIAQLKLRNEILRKWFVYILILGVLSSPLVYKKFFA